MFEQKSIQSPISKDSYSFQKQEVFLFNNGYVDWKHFFGAVRGGGVLDHLSIRQTKVEIRDKSEHEIVLSASALSMQ